MDGRLLLEAARGAIADALGVSDAHDPDAGVPDAGVRPPDPDASPEEATAKGAAFVTLTIDGRLRGCIGSLEAWRPLLDDVRANARHAAFDDPRFPPLTPVEFARVRLEVSVLTPPEPLVFTSEADLLGQLVPHEDGLVLEASGHRGTFLPQVWEQLPTPTAFLRGLKRKAGLPETWWGPGVRVSRYRVTAFEE